MDNRGRNEATSAMVLSLSQRICLASAFLSPRSLMIRCKVLYFLAAVTVVLLTMSFNRLDLWPVLSVDSTSQLFRQPLQQFRLFMSYPLQTSPPSAFSSLKPKVISFALGNVTTAHKLNNSSRLLAPDSMSGQQQEVQPKTSEKSNKKHNHVFFLKVHKAASTTVMNILCRFALKYNLLVMLPKQVNVISESSKFWRASAIELPANISYFDILCNHLVFNEQIIRSSLHPDAKFIGIVREPFSQAVSAFFYYSNVYRVPYLTRIPGPNPLQTYLKSPSLWEVVSINQSYTHDRMSFDFGMDLSGNLSAIAEYLTYLNRTFDLVLISERFDESMVLLKRLLNWHLQDILYTKANVFHMDRSSNSSFKIPDNYTFTTEDRQIHRRFNSADYALYEYFSSVFQKKVEAEGEGFPKEVAAFQSLCQQANEFCTSNREAKTVTLEATEWSSRFQLSRSDCLLMTTPEIRLINIVRKKQLQPKAGTHWRGNGNRNGNAMRKRKPFIL